jgi:hypothetical protein
MSEPLQDHEYRWQVEELTEDEIRELNAGGKAELPCCQDSPEAGFGDVEPADLPGGEAD